MPRLAKRSHRRQQRQRKQSNRSRRSKKRHSNRQNRSVKRSQRRHRRQNKKMSGGGWGMIRRVQEDFTQMGGWPNKPTRPSIKYNLVGGEVAVKN